MTAIAIFLSLRPRLVSERHLRRERAQKRAELKALLAEIADPNGRDDDQTSSLAA